MISPIRSTNFLNVKTITPQERSKRCSNLYSTPCDSVSFSGKLNRLSDESIGLVQNFAKKLQLNKVYKFDNPNVERFQMTSIASPKNPPNSNPHIVVDIPQYINICNDLFNESPILGNFFIAIKHAKNIINP